MSSFSALRRWSFIIFLLFGRSIFLSAQVSTDVDSALKVLDTLISSRDEKLQEDEVKEDPFMDQPGKKVQVTPRHLPPGKLEEIKKEKTFWYADSSFIKKSKAPDYSTPFFMKDWVKTLFWILVVGGFGVALAWYLYHNNIRLFRKKDVIVKEVSQEELPENIFDINYERELTKALVAGDHRLAVRIEFLRLLKILTEKNLIQYRQDRTNMDYIFQLGGKPFYPDFFRVVRHYEYSWYGHFEVSRENYELIAGDFRKLNQQLN